MHNNLEVWLPFVEDMKDHSPNSRTVAVNKTGTPSYSIGVLGPALYGNNQCANLTVDADSLGVFSAHSFAGWIRYDYISNSGNPSDQELRICYVWPEKNSGTYDNPIGLYLTVDNSNGEGTIGMLTGGAKGGFKTGVWYHVGYTYDGNRDWKATVYIDGVAYPTQFWSTAFGGANGGRYTLQFLEADDSTVNVFPSEYKASDFRFYTRCLTAQEMKMLASKQLAYYPMNFMPKRGAIIDDCKPAMGPMKYDLTTTHVGDAMLHTNDPTKKGCHSKSFDFQNKMQLKSRPYTAKGSSFTLFQKLSNVRTTICCWYKTGGGGALFDIETSTRNLWIDQNGNYGGMRLGYFKDSLQYTTNTFASSSSSQFSHLALVFENTKTCKIYINGKLILTQDVNQYPRGALTIGYSEYGNPASNYTNCWEGQISDFQIYATALTQKEIQDIIDQSVFINLTDGTWNAKEVIEEDGADTSICPTLKTITANDYWMARDQGLEPADFLVDVVERAVGWCDINEI